jgi:hypothetical protein
MERSEEKTILQEAADILYKTSWAAGFRTENQLTETVKAFRDITRKLYDRVMELDHRAATDTEYVRQLHTEIGQLRSAALIQTAKYNDTVGQFLEYKRTHRFEDSSV